MSDVANGVSVSNGSAYGDQVKYSCHSGFHLVGEAMRICSELGDWSGTDPLCKGMTLNCLDKKYMLVVLF